MQAHPRHLGLARRQSYDPLSSTKSHSLSLGALPLPSFGALPLGHTSVPAIESNRFLGSGFRSVSGPNEAGQRTPGGSLVVGSEVFGFGRQTTQKDARERWGNGVVAGRDEDDDEGSISTPTGGEGTAGQQASSDWPSEFEQAVSGAPKPDFQLNGQGKNLSADFNLGGLPRPSLRTYGSSADLRSPPNLTKLNEDPTSVAGRNDGAPASAQTGATRMASTLPPDAALTDSTGLGSFAAGGVHTSNEVIAPSGYAYMSPSEQPPYMGQPYGGPFQQPPPRRSYGAFDQSSPDDLAAGLRNMSLGGANNDPYRASQGSRPPIQQQRGPAFSPGPYGGRDALPPPTTRQSSGPYPPYYLQQGAQYLPQDPYAPYSDPNAYFQQPSDLQSIRRDSGNSPPWGMPVGMPPVDYSPQQASHNSRQGSFSYSPALSYGLAPGAPYGTSPEQHSGPVGAAVFPPVMGQQQQILLGRGLRSAVEYIAPGPPVQSYGQYGYGGVGRYPEDMRPVRSPMLEEFRTNRHRSWELTDLVNHIVEFSGDQLGSRHIQTKLETATSDEKQLVFDEVLPNMLQLSTDVFANYVIQKFFEQGSQAQKTAMANVLEGHILQLSLQMYGCRVVQKALEYVLVDQQVRLVKELDGHILKCARDAQSNHVVQRALERVPSEHITFITDACVNQVHALATHPYGCRVLQRIFENCPPSQTRVLLDELHRYTQNLIQDQYGNYVIQWIIEKGEPADRSLVISKVYGQVLPLAQQKFASNVVEKCIVWATEAERRNLIDEVLAPAADGSSVVKAMLVHPYANYVMQSTSPFLLSNFSLLIPFSAVEILHTAVGTQREQLFSQTAIQLANLRKYASSYSKHLIAIEKLLSSERGRVGLY
ncbi:pumilio RNA-binding family, partial [Phenoliferia sp. Uapishka_3]